MADTQGEGSGNVGTEAGQAPVPAATPSPSPSPSPSESPPAQSSPTPGEPSKPSLMDAVLKVVKPTPEPDVLGRPMAERDAAPTPQATQSNQAETEAEEEAALDDDSVPQDISPKGQKKVRRLIEQRRELRDQVAQLQPDAEVGFTLSSFARDNDLAPDDIVSGMTAMAAIRRGDYAQFYQIVAPYVRHAQEVLGLVLPEDLGRAVKAGQVNEVVARELAQHRFRQARAEEQARTATHSRDTERVQYVQNDVQRAVTALENRFAASDPDYKAKADAVRRAAQAMLFERGGNIASVQEALEVVQAAYNEVNAQMRRFVPQPRATNPMPNGHSQQPLARQPPKTLMEAAIAGLENARRAAG